MDEDELDELAERPGAELVDFEEERVKPYAVFDVQAGQRLLRRQSLELSARASVFNITNARYAYNFGNPFSGTHFGAPRSFRLDFRLALRLRGRVAGCERPLQAAICTSLAPLLPPNRDAAPLRAMAGQLHSTEGATEVLTRYRPSHRMLRLALADASSRGMTAVL